MLACVQWRRNANAGGQITRPHATADDDIISVNRTIVRIHARDAITIVTNSGNFGVFKDFGAASAGTFGQGLRNIDGIRIAVAWDMNTADDIIDIDDMRQFFDFLWCYDMHGQVKYLGHGCAALQLLKAFGIGGHRYRTALAIARCLAGFCLKPAIEFAGIFCELGHVDAGPQLPDQPRGMPCRAAGQLLAFQQDHVVPTDLGQVICNRTADDTATDDDDFCLFG